MITRVFKCGKGRQKNKEGDVIMDRLNTPDFEDGQRGSLDTEQDWTWIFPGVPRKEQHYADTLTLAQ